MLERFELPKSAVGAKYTRDTVYKSYLKFRRDKLTVDLSKMKLNIVFMYEHDNQIFA